MAHHHQQQKLLSSPTTTTITTTTPHHHHKNDNIINNDNSDDYAAYHPLHHRPPHQQDSFAPPLSPMKKDTQMVDTQMLHERHANATRHANARPGSQVTQMRPLHKNVVRSPNFNVPLGMRGPNASGAASSFSPRSQFISSKNIASVLPEHQLHRAGPGQSVHLRSQLEQRFSHPITPQKNKTDFHRPREKMLQTSQSTGALPKVKSRKSTPSSMQAPHAKHTQLKERLSNPSTTKCDKNVAHGPVANVSTSKAVEFKGASRRVRDGKPILACQFELPSISRIAPMQQAAAIQNTAVPYKAASAGNSKLMTAAQESHQHKPKQTKVIWKEDSKMTSNKNSSSSGELVNSKFSAVNNGASVSKQLSHPSSNYIKNSVVSSPSVPIMQTSSRPIPVVSNLSMHNSEIPDRGDYLSTSASPPRQCRKRSNYNLLSVKSQENLSSPLIRNQDTKYSQPDNSRKALSKLSPNILSSNDTDLKHQKITVRKESEDKIMTAGNHLANSNCGEMATVSATADHVGNSSAIVSSKLKLLEDCASSKKDVISKRHNRIFENKNNELKHKRRSLGSVFPESFSTEESGASTRESHPSSSNSRQHLLKSLSSSLDELLNTIDDQNVRETNRRASGGRVLGTLPDLISISGRTIMNGGIFNRDAIDNEDWKPQNRLRSHTCVTPLTNIASVKLIPDNGEEERSFSITDHSPSATCFSLSKSSPAHDEATSLDANSSKIHSEYSSFSFAVSPSTPATTAGCFLLVDGSNSENTECKVQNSSSVFKIEDAANAELVSGVDYSENVSSHSCSVINIDGASSDSLNFVSPPAPSMITISQCTAPVTNQSTFVSNQPVPQQNLTINISESNSERSATSGVLPNNIEMKTYNEQSTVIPNNINSPASSSNAMNASTSSNQQRERMIINSVSGVPISSASKPPGMNGAKIDSNRSRPPHRRQHHQRHNQRRKPG